MQSNAFLKTNGRTLFKLREEIFYRSCHTNVTQVLELRKSKRFVWIFGYLAHKCRTFNICEKEGESFSLIKKESRRNVWLNPTNLIYNLLNVTYDLAQP